MTWNMPHMPEVTTRDAKNVQRFWRKSKAYHLIVMREHKEVRGGGAMKLLCCKICSDVVGLTVGVWRNCECGKSGGVYMPDGDTVTIAGPSFIIAFQNGLRRRLITRGEAWIYSESNGKVTRMAYNPGRLPERAHP